MLIRGGHWQAVGLREVKISGIVGGEAMLAAKRLDPVEDSVSL